MDNWRPLVGYEGIYEIRPGTDGGAVKRITPIQRSSVGRILKGFDQFGYARAVLSKSGERPKYKRLHELILLTFVGPKPTPKHRGLHKDDCKMNNSLNNLYWGTAKQNVEDAVANKKHWKFTKPNTMHKAWITRKAKNA